MYQKGLYSNRGCVIERNAWNVEIPLRTDKTPFADDAPFMINTQASLEELNTRLKEKVVIERFRPVILVDKCAAWDEDKWLSVHIGDVVLQCLKPCLRCVMTTIDPSTGTKNPAIEPLKTLREFRLAPEGPMRDDCKDNPIFGVDAGLIRPGHIHVGQTVYVRYKSEYLKQTPFYTS
ncbi:MOSC domain protein [Ancylostoma caninum]|uniref:MOSC domain protein n=2 Tax=Ancylostoma caninum TaxID=29170 RepID=A0A368F1X3_ANCCA|nr:MOSC domain protein [Ancylostoma caninum]